MRSVRERHAGADHPAAPIIVCHLTPKPMVLSPHSKERIRDPPRVLLSGGVMVMDLLYQEFHFILFEQPSNASDSTRSFLTVGGGK